MENNLSVKQDLGDIFIVENKLRTKKEEVLAKIGKEKNLYFKSNPAYFELADSQNVVYEDYSEEWVKFQLEHGVKPELIQSFLNDRQYFAEHDVRDAQRQLDKANAELTKCKNMRKTIEEKMSKNSKVDKSKGNAAKVVIEKVAASKTDGRAQ